MGCVINCHRNASAQGVGVESVWGGGSGERVRRGEVRVRGGVGGSSSVTGIHSVVRAPYLSASLNQFHAEVS